MWNLQSFYENAVINKRRIVLCGAGEQGMVWLKFLKWINATAVCFCDNDPQKQNRLIDNIPILEYVQAYERYSQAYFIPSALNGLQEIVSQLKNDGMFNDLFDGLNINVYSFWIERFSCYEEMIGYFTSSQNQSLHSAVMPFQFNRMLSVSYIYLSGVYYFASLLDGHSQILSIPQLTSPLIVDYWVERWSKLDGIELTLDVYYYCMENGLIETEEKPPAWKCFLDENSCFKKDLQVNFDYFYTTLHKNIQFSKKNLGGIIKAIYSSYAQSKGIFTTLSDNILLLFHFHSFDANLVNRFIELVKSEFEKVDVLITIKDPLVGLSRVIQAFSTKSTEHGVAAQGLWTGTSFDRICERYLNPSWLKLNECATNVAFVKFESLKLDTKNTMEKVCNFIDIRFEEILLRTTALGKTNYYKGVRESIITGNTKASLNYESEILTVFDKFRFDMLFCWVKSQLGYVEFEDYNFLKYITDDCLKELFYEPFKFEEYLGNYEFFNAERFHESIVQYILTLKSQQGIEKIPATIIEL